MAHWLTNEDEVTFEVNLITYRATVDSSLDWRLHEDVDGQWVLCGVFRTLQECYRSVGYNPNCSYCSLICEECEMED